MTILREKLLKQLMLELKNVVPSPLAGGLNLDSYWGDSTPDLSKHRVHTFTWCLGYALASFHHYMSALFKHMKSCYVGK